MQAVAVRMMVCQEARDCVEKININMTNVRILVIDLYDRDGWSALGYANWTECVNKEFKQGGNYIFRQLAAAQIEQNLNDSAKNNLPMGQLGTIPERQLRPLSKLTPEQQRECWKRSVDTTPEGKMTAAHVSTVVREMTEAATNLFPVSPRVHAGEVSGHGFSRFYSRERAHRASGGKRYE